MSIITLVSAQGIYDDLEEKTALISTKWRETRLPRTLSFQSAAKIMDAVKKPNINQKASLHQFAITAKAIIASTLYDIRHHLVNKKHAFTITPIKTNNKSLLTHTCIVFALNIMTKVANEEILSRMSSSLTHKTYPFDQTNFRSTIKSKTLQKLGFMNQIYKVEIQRAVGTEWFFDAFLRWFNELDQEYDIKNDDDFTKEALAIQKGYKGSVSSIQNQNGKPYYAYYDEFGIKVAIFKDQRKGKQEKERTCYELSKDIAPESIARNFIFGQGLIEQYIPFIDRKEARHLLLKANQNNTFPKAVYNMTIQFSTRKNEFVRYCNGQTRIRDGFKSNMSSFITIMDQFQNNLNYLRYKDDITLHDLFSKIVDNVWDMQYYYDLAKINLSSQNFRKLGLHRQEAEILMKNLQDVFTTFGESLEISSPNLAYEIKTHYALNFCFRIWDAHASNSMVHSKNGRLRLSIIDTEYAYFDESLELPVQTCPIPVFFKAATKSLALNKIEISKKGFNQKEAVTRKANNFLTSPLKIFEKYFYTLNKPLEIEMDYEKDGWKDPSTYNLYQLRVFGKSPFYTRPY